MMFSKLCFHVCPDVLVSPNPNHPTRRSRRGARDQQLTGHAHLQAEELAEDFHLEIGERTDHHCMSTYICLHFGSSHFGSSVLGELAPHLHTGYTR